MDLCAPPVGPLAALDTDEAIVDALNSRLMAFGEQKLQQLSKGQRVQVLWIDPSGRKGKWVAEVDEVIHTAHTLKERGVSVLWVDKNGKISNEYEAHFVSILDLHQKLFLPADKGYEPITGRSHVKLTAPLDICGWPVTAVWCCPGSRAEVVPELDGPVQVLSQTLVTQVMTSLSGPGLGC